MNRLLKLTTFIALAAWLGGCATHYQTPAGGVSLAEISDTEIKDYYQRQPATAFPANIAIVRVQDSGYETRTASGYGYGRFTTVTTRDVEDEADIETIGRLPLVAGVAPVGRMLLPSNASSIKDLRVPAAKLKADLLLVYSIDTTFAVEGKSYGPLSLISLGLIPNKRAHVTATVSGVLVDVRTGYIYGTTEATAREDQRATIWSTEQAIDTSRVKAEGDAFEEFVVGFGDLWKSVVDVHAATRPQPATTAPAVVRDNDTHYHVRFNDR